MRLLVDAAYVLAAAVTAPVWLWPRSRAGKLRTDWQARLGRIAAVPGREGRPRVLIHAVSVGEVNALRHLVDRLERAPLKPEIVISVTTDTGIARARSLFGGRHDVVRYPFDLSWAVDSFLEATLPDVVALVELEVWPNFVRACGSRHIPVCVINGRLSERSFRRYRHVRPLLRPTFARLAAVAAQSDPYAERFR
jgi:3-deoxy-D-manno-octulosonic-acid transferase